MDTLIYEHIIHGLSSFLWRQCQNTSTQLWRAYAKKTNDTKARQVFINDEISTHDTKPEVLLDASTATDTLEPRQDIELRDVSCQTDAADILPKDTGFHERFMLRANIQFGPTEAAGPVHMSLDTSVARTQWGPLTVFEGTAASVFNEFVARAEEEYGPVTGVDWSVDTFYEAFTARASEDVSTDGTLVPFDPPARKFFSA